MGGSPCRMHTHILADAVVYQVVDIFFHHSPQENVGGCTERPTESSFVLVTLHHAAGLFSNPSTR